MAKGFRGELSPVTNIPLRLVNSKERVGGYGENEYIRVADDGFDVEAMTIMNRLREQYEELLSDKILVRFLAGAINMKQKGMTQYPVLELIGLLDPQLYNPVSRKESALHFMEPDHYNDVIWFKHKRHVDAVAAELNKLSIGKRRY